MRISSVAAFAVLAGLGTAASGQAPVAQGYPEKPVRFIAPFAAGGVSDVSARIAAEYLSRTLNTSFIVENSPGAGGTIGTANVKQAKPDGYTLLSGTSTSLVAGSILSREQVPYDAEKDFVPAGYTNRYDLILITALGAKYNTLAALFDAMKKTPDSINYGTAGAGASLSLAGAYLSHLSGRKIQPIDYKGAAAMLPDLLAGRVTFGFTSLQTAMAQINSGKAIALAIGSEKRHGSLPNVPTMAEAGLPEFMKLNWSFWNGIFAPLGTPRPVLERLNAAVNRMVRDPAVLKRFADIGTDPMDPMNLDQSAALYRGEFTSWRPALREMTAGR